MQNEKRTPTTDDKKKKLEIKKIEVKGLKVKSAVKAGARMEFN